MERLFLILPKKDKWECRSSWGTINGLNVKLSSSENLTSYRPEDKDQNLGL